MTEALAIITGVSGICVTILKLITTLSQFIDDVEQVPAEVQRVSNELAVSYGLFGQVKLLIAEPRESPFHHGWESSLESALKLSEERLQKLDSIVRKSKVTESKSTLTQVWRSIKYTFKESDVKDIRIGLTYTNGLLTNVLQLLSESRAAEAEKQLAKIQDMVEILLKSRKDVKEILVVLGNDDPRADFVLSDRTSHNQRLQSSPQDNQQEKSSAKQVHPMAYQPTAEEIAAKQLAACKTWSLRFMSFHGSGDEPTNRYLTPYDSKNLTIRISQGPRLAFIVTKDFSAGDYDINRATYFFTYSDIFFHERMGTVYGSLTTLTSALRHTLQVGEAEFDFGYEGLDDAEEFYACAKHLAQLHRRCWESHVIAWSPIEDKFNVDTPDNIKQSAAVAAERALCNNF